MIRTSALLLLLLSPFASDCQPFFQRVMHEETCTNIYLRETSYFSDGSCFTSSNITDPAYNLSSSCAYSYVSPDGTTQWMKASDSLGGYGAVQLPGGDIVVLGYSRYLGTPGITGTDGNFVLTRFTTGGTVVWTKAYGNQYDDFGNYIHLLPNGNIEVWGYSENYAVGSFDNFRARISTAGVLLDMKFQSSTNTTYDDYYAYDSITGNVFSLSSGTAQTFYVKCTDSTFNTVWENHFTTNYSSVNSINLTTNGSLLVTGTTGSTASAVKKAFILNLAPTGTINWAQKYDFGGFCRFNSAAVTPSGNIVATGSSDAYTEFTQFGDYQSRMITMICTGTGVPIHTTVYGNDVEAEGQEVFAQSDSVFYFSGAHGLIKRDDGFLFLRLGPTLTNPAFCYKDATVTQMPLSYVSTPYPTTYTVVGDTVAVLNDNAGYITVPVTNILICPTVAHTYQTGSETGRVVTATSDSCFVFITSDGALKMTKYDPEGHILWSHLLNINSPYYPGTGYDIIEASNGDLVVGHGGGHACLTRTDRDGNPIWCTDKSVGGNEVSLIGSVAETPEHDFVAVAGLQQGNFPTTARFAIIKYDSLGNSIWTKEYANLQSSSGGLDADGNGISACGNGIYNAFTIQTDTGGNVIWSKQITNAGPTSEVTLDFAERCPNGDVLYAGYIRANSPQTYQRPYLVRFDSTGNLVWQKMFQPGSELLSHTVSLIQVSGDQYIVSALGPGGSTANFKSFTFRIDAAGNVLWSRCVMPTAAGGVEYGQGAVGYDSSLAFPASEYGANINFRFDKYSSSGQGPCDAVSATVVGIVPGTTTIVNAGLTAFNVSLTETSLTVTTVVDSSGREFVCAEGDTSFYNPPPPLNTEQSNAVINLQEHKMYPVPTSGNLTIDGFVAGQECIISVYSVTGQLCDQENASADGSGKCALTLDNSIPGVYFIQVVDPDQNQLTTGMIIIQ